MNGTPQREPGESRDPRDPAGPQGPVSEAAATSSTSSVGPGRKEHARAEADAWNITGYLLGGPIAWGGIGWLLDRWAGTEVFLPVGLVMGMALALYLIWVRYGRY